MRFNLKNIEILNECRNEQEIKQNFKNFGVNITNEKLNKLKENFSRKEKNCTSLNYDQLESVAGGVTFLAQYHELRNLENFPWIKEEASLHMLKGTEREPGFNIIFNHLGEGISLSTDDLTSVLNGDDNCIFSCLLPYFYEKSIEIAYNLRKALEKTYNDALEDVKNCAKVLYTLDGGYLMLSNGKIIAPIEEYLQRERSYSL